MKLLNITDTTQNIIHKTLWAYTHLKPKILTLVTTNTCNSKCVMCNIWKKPSTNELTLNEYKDIITNSNLIKNHVSIVNITGGEPFLRNDVVDLVDTLVTNLKNLEEIRFATNGFAVKKIIEDMTEIVEFPCNFNIKISIDGLEKTHDKIRGIPGGFFLAENTINKLCNLREIAPNLDVAIAHTIMPQNYQETLNVYNHYPVLDFICKVAYHAKSFENKEFDIGFNDWQIREIITNLEYIYAKESIKLSDSPRNFSRFKKIAYLLFLRHHIRYLENSNIPQPPCHATFSSITVESDGKVYCCGIIQKLMGDLREEGFDAIWTDERNDETRNFINAGKCKCSNACDTLPSLIAGNIPEVVKKFII